MKKYRQIWSAMKKYNYILLTISFSLLICLLLFLFGKEKRMLNDNDSGKYTSQWFRSEISSNINLVKRKSNLLKPNKASGEINNKLQEYNELLNNERKLQKKTSADLVTTNLLFLSKQVNGDWKTYTPFMRAIINFMNEFPDECLQAVTNLLINPVINPYMYVNLKDLEIKIFDQQDKYEEAYKNAMEVITSNNSNIMLETGNVYLDFVNVALNVGKTNEAIKVANTAYNYLENKVDISTEDEYKENLGYMAIELYWLYYDNGKYKKAENIINEALRKLDENVSSVKELNVLLCNIQKISNHKLEK